MTTQAQRHNALASLIVREHFGEILDNGATAGDVMVLAESIVLGALLINARVFGQTDPAQTIEAMAERLTTRFAEASAAGIA